MSEHTIRPHIDIGAGKCGRCGAVSDFLWPYGGIGLCNDCWSKLEAALEEGERRAAGSMSEHTPGPWMIGADYPARISAAFMPLRNGGASELIGCSQIIGNPEDTMIVAAAANDADARRIVAAVNATEGFLTDQLEQDVIGDLVGALDDIGNLDVENHTVVDAMRIARDTLIRALGSWQSLEEYRKARGEA